MVSKEIKRILIELVEFMERDMELIDPSNRSSGHSLRKLTRLKNKIKRLGVS